MAKKEDESKQEAAAEKGKKKGSPMGLLLIINMVLTILMLGLGGFIAWKLITLETPVLATTGKSDEAAEKKTPGILMELDNVTVNLADQDENRFLRVKINLEVQDEEAQKEIEKYHVQIKDLIINTLSSKFFRDIRTPQGKFDLKEELIFRINSLVGGEPVKDLYFTDFIAQ